MAKSDLASLVADAGQRPAPVYLLVGEPFHTEPAAHALIDVLVPPERRSFNLETYDGRTSAIAPILDSLRMPGLFRGTKVIWMREPTLFLSGERRGDLADALFAAWSEDRRAEAAEKLLVLAALAGWTQETLDAIDWASLPAGELRELLGTTSEGNEREVLAAVHAFCRERQLAVSAYRDESGLLEDFLESGMPPGSVLLFTAAAVDRRKRLFKRIAEVGAVAEFSVTRERSGALAAESIDEIVDRKLAEHGKRIDPGARRLLGQRAGSDPAQLAMEAEKLCLYAGERPLIREDDVRASVRDLAESWVFDFTRALAQREAVAAVSLLRGLAGQGEHPLRLLAMIARELRMLLLARDCLAEGLAPWNARTTFAVFRDQLLPKLPDTQKDAFGGTHPFVIYQAVQNASRTSTTALQRALLRLQELDVKLKSSGGDPEMLLESFVLDTCRAR